MGCLLRCDRGNDPRQLKPVDSAKESKTEEWKMFVHCEGENKMATVE